MFVPIVCLFVFVFYVIFAIAFLMVKMHEYKKIKNEECQLITHTCNADEKNKDIPKVLSNAVKLLSERKYGFIQNYHLFQITNKTFGLMSITYSIIGLMSLSIDVTKTCDMNIWLGYLICFVSIIFVVLALYLTPTNRSAQYLAAWRKCDEKMCEVLASTCYYVSLHYRLKDALATETRNDDEEIINKIREEAKSITKVISEAEALLSGEEG